MTLCMKIIFIDQESPNLPSIWINFKFRGFFFFFIIVPRRIFSYNIYFRKFVIGNFSSVPWNVNLLQPKDVFFKDKCENTRKYYISKLQDLSQSLLNDDDIDVNKTEQYMSEIQSARKDALEAFKSYTYMGI